jgi:arginase
MNQDRIIKSTKNAVVITIPLDLGAKNLGVDIGPEAFLYSDLEPKLKSSGINIDKIIQIKSNKRKDVEMGNPRMRYMSEIVRVSTKVADIVRKYLDKGEKVIGLGGDHSINLGLFSGAASFCRDVDKTLGMIYLDAHGDMNTHETTLSGNIHGMHVASLLGLGPEPLKQVGGDFVKLKFSNLLHIGGNDMDQAEIDLIRNQKIPNFSLNDVMLYGLAPLIKMIDTLAQRCDYIWVSLDLDVIDKIYAPGAGMPSNAGLSYREVSFICNYIGETCPVIGLDIVEYNPLQDKDKITVELGIELTAKLLGKEYSWYTGYLEQNKI